MSGLVSQPRSGGENSHTSSASASDGASVSRCTPIFMVFERASSTATMRCLAYAATQTIQRGVNRGGVMREVVVHADAAHFAAHLHAPRDACERLQRRDGLRDRHARVARRGDGRERVLHVVRAHERPLHHAARRAASRAPRSASSPARHRRAAPSTMLRPPSRVSRARSLRARSSSPSRASRARRASSAFHTMRPLPGTVRTR